MNMLEQEVRFSQWDDVFGPVLMTAEAGTLSGLYFLGQKWAPVIETHWRRDEGLQVFSQAKSQLQAYAQGRLQRFDVPLVLSGTEFQKKVWDALLRIEFGQTTTYGQLAGQIGAPSAVRAVGAAVGRNPVSVIVPCHRVIGADGSLTGYAGGLDRKRCLLAHEGVLRAGLLPAQGLEGLRQR